MKKLSLLFVALFVAIMITGCQSRSSTVRFNTETGEMENVDNGGTETVNSGTTEEGNDDAMVKEDGDMEDSDTSQKTAEEGDDGAMAKDEANMEKGAMMDDDTGKKIDELINDGSMGSLPSTGANLNLSVLIALALGALITFATRPKKA